MTTVCLDPEVAPELKLSLYAIQAQHHDFTGRTAAEVRRGTNRTAAVLTIVAALVSMYDCSLFLH